jgi:hypothetical protein
MILGQNRKKKKIYPLKTSKNPAEMNSILKTSTDGGHESTNLKQKLNPLPKHHTGLKASIWAHRNKEEA